MIRAYVPTDGVASWKARLADPDKQWKREASAFEAAVSWELALRSNRGLPASVAEVLDQQPEFGGSSVLVALPEHKVVLPGGTRSSQTDVWVLLRCGDGLVSMAVEAKADEAFGETIEEWTKDASEGKTERLAFLCDLLKQQSPHPNLRYQLLHRTASAVLEARRWGASAAVMMVQCFRSRAKSLEDFSAFGTWLGASVASGQLVKLGDHTEPSVYLGWTCSPLATDQEIARAAV